MFDLINKKDPESIAIIERGITKTYQDLNEDIKQIEALLIPREIIILLCNNSYECLLIYLSCLRKGSIPLLLSDNVCESHLNEYIKRYLPKYVFSPKIINHQKNNLSYLKTYFIYKHSNHNLVKNKELILLLTTSGSTGNPKVVKVSKKNLISNTISICKYLNLSKKERHITILPMNYTYGLSSYFYIRRINNSKLGAFIQRDFGLILRNINNIFSGVRMHMKYYQNIS